MTIEIITFTKAGMAIEEKLVHYFRRKGHRCTGYVKRQLAEDDSITPGLAYLEETVTQWTEKRFSRADALIYICATGIAVRAIAPFLKDKFQDPAVLVIDEQGEYVISLLSGHIGGANKLANEAAKVVDGIPVITTASDGQGKTSIDQWAQSLGLILSDRDDAKMIAAAVVNDEPVGFFSDFLVDYPAPVPDTRGQMCHCNIWITCKSKTTQDSIPGMFLQSDAKVLRLIPKIVSLGVGCQRDTSYSRIKDAVDQVLEENNIEPSSICRLCSIDRKADEEGLIAYGKELNVPFITFSADELEKIKIVSIESEFVRKVTGLGNVCERAALLGAGQGGRLLVKKQIVDGITVAVAISKYIVGESKI